ncbi:MAG: DUF6166 domain-containing protein [Sulfurimonas sp.]
MAIVMNNHVFKGHRTLLGSKFVTYGELELPTRYDLYPTSESGFEWGNSSKGANQLAFSILCQLSNAEVAKEYAIAFTNAKKQSKQKNNVVKDVCKTLDITQKQLAEILEVPEGTVSSWAVKNEIPRLGKKAIEFYIQNQKNQKIVDSYKNFINLLQEA